MPNDLHFIDQGSGTPVVFQHGLGANLEQVRSLLGGLDNIRLISMDCPGHGLSALWEGTSPSFNAYADHLLSLMDEIGLERAIFGGISMGSGIALNIAQRRPERVSGLWLVRPAWVDQGSPTNLSILTLASEALRQHKPLDQFRKLEAYQKIEDELPLAARSLDGLFDPLQRSELPAVLNSMVGDRPFQSLKHLSEIKQPALVVGNHDDPLHPLDMAATIHQYLPRSEFHTVISRYINDAKHGMEVRNLFNSFLTDHEKSLER